MIALDPGVASVAAATVTAVLTLVGLVVTSRTRRENSTQHAASQEALGLLAGEVRVVAGKLDDHISWHLGPTDDTHRARVGVKKRETRS